MQLSERNKKIKREDDEAKAKADAEMDMVKVAHTYAQHAIK